MHAGLPTAWPAPPFPSELAVHRDYHLPPSIAAQLQSLISSVYSNKARVQIDLFSPRLVSNSPLNLAGFIPHPLQGWNTLWAPSLAQAEACAALALASQAQGLFIGTEFQLGSSGHPPASLAPWRLSLAADTYWSVPIALPGLPSLRAAFFNCVKGNQPGALRRTWDPGHFPLRTIDWFDAIPFPRGVAPPFPLLSEELLPLPPRPPIAVPPASGPPRPLSSNESGRPSRTLRPSSPPDWLKPALPASEVQLPPHSPRSPLLEEFKARLNRHPFPSPAVQRLFLLSCEVGFGSVTPTGSHRWRSEPRNSAKALPHMDRLRSKFLALTQAVPPLAYGPFLGRPPFPRRLESGLLGPQAIVSPLSVAFKGEAFQAIDPYIDPEFKLSPDYPKSVGKGEPRLVQNASAPDLPSPSAPSAQRKGSGWSLNSRLHAPPLRQVFCSARSIAELLAFFGPGTVVIQTDFPAAYKNCRLPADSLFAHVSKTVTLKNGLWVTEYWVDAAQIFGSGHAPMLWELFVVVFEHLVRHSNALLRLVVHYVDNLFIFLPPFLLGDQPHAVTNQASQALFTFFNSLPQAHHDDDVGSAFLALGHYFHSLPTPSVGLKPTREPIVAALLGLLAHQSSIPARLAIATRGLFSWLAVIVPFISFVIPVVSRLEAAAKAALRAGRSHIPVPPSIPLAIRILAAVTTAADLGSASPLLAASVPSPPESVRPLPLLLPLRPSPFSSASAGGTLGAVLRSDASPHFGCGGYSISHRFAFHAAWDHRPHSAQADLISSTLAEAIAALTLVLEGARPGVNVLQVDSAPLAAAFNKGYSLTCPLTNEALLLMFAHVTALKGSLLFIHIRRVFNSASDRLAAGADLSLVAPLISLETGIPPSSVLKSFTILKCAPAHSTLRLLTARIQNSPSTALLPS